MCESSTVIIGFSFSSLQIFHYVCRIADVLIALQQHGNIHYLHWSLSFTCDSYDVVSDLSAQAHRMESHLEEWRNEVSEKRNEFYELNYFTTQQLLFLAEDLGRVQTFSGKADVNPKTMALLHSISPEVSQKHVKKHLLDTPSNLEKQTLPSKESNERSDESSKPVVQPSFQEKIIKHDVSYETRLSLSEAKACPKQDENQSPNSVIVNEGLAASVITTESQLAPEPKFTTEHLTPNQSKILINSMDNYGFAKKLVLLAFDHCDNSDTEHEIIDWCIEHQIEFQYADSDASSESSASAEESNHEVEGEVHNLLSIIEFVLVHKFIFIFVIDEELFSPQEPIESTEPLQVNETESPEATVPHFDTKTQASVDEQHPVVVQLRSLGYELEECIEAAEHHPEDAVDAQNYLILKEQGDLFDFALVKRFVLHSK